MQQKRGKAGLFGFLKWICVALLLLFLAGQLGRDRQSAAPFDSVLQAVTARADMAAMQEADSQMIRRLYGLNPGDYEAIALYYPATNMGAEELLLVKLADPAQQAAVSEAIASRLATQLASFDGYGVEQYAMLQAAVTDLQGNYVLFVSAADPAAVRQAFQAAL